MKDLIKQLQERHKKAMNRLAAINKEQQFLEAEVDHLEELIKQYDSSSYYYDIIEEERNVTAALVDKPEQQRKPTPTTLSQVRTLAEGLGTITITDVEEYFDNPPARSTISRWLRELYVMGYLEKLQPYPVKYRYISDDEALGKEDANE